MEGKFCEKTYVGGGNFQGIPPSGSGTSSFFFSFFTVKRIL